MKWYFKQLLPLTYRTKYGECMPDGTVRPRSVVWRMWFGRSFRIEDRAAEA